jgi:PAS domain S-box-containing protein
MDRKEENSLYEGSLVRYEKLYLMLLDAIPSSVLMVDRDMRIISANHNFLAKSRRSLDDTIGHRLEDVFPAIILDQIDIIQQIRQVFDNNQPTLGQRMSYRSPGVPMRIYYYRILPFSMESEGMVENVMFLMDDVTEQIRLSEEVRRVESHLASVFESASDIILSTDINGNVLSWNTAAEKISGYTFEELEGQSIFEYFAEDCQEAIRDVFSRLKTEKKDQMCEWELTSKNGQAIQVAWICSPIKDEESRITGIVAVGRDLTEQRKLEMQLLQTQKSAALGVMAGGIAHEIRNPLAICSSASQFLMEDDIDPAFRKECAEKIHAGIKRASVIIENLLRFARPPVKSDVEELNLSPLIKETMTLIANQARIQKIKLKRHLPDSPVLIGGNASLLQQVFMNLFLNGIRAMPEGGTLTVLVEKNEATAVIRVTDTGGGISRRDLDKIFDPFYTTSEVGKGTGLGLSLCYSIVAQHDGHIEGESTEGEGSTFTITLPML